jgi:3-dehydroquinate dehydratase-1
LIISYHNFVETPSLEELKDILDRMKKFTPDVYKISVMPKTGEDVKKIYDLTFYFKRNFLEDFVFISM